MRWVLWLLMGIALALAMLLGVLVLAAARLNPWLARRLAGSGLAVGALRLCWDVFALRMNARR
jgi:hypothetical protein